ncbi:amine oxidase [Sesbania bispinosa]|nr:amine oxidase [Sesbania bispinosa]
MLRRELPTKTSAEQEVLTARECACRPAWMSERLEAVEKTPAKVWALGRVLWARIMRRKRWREKEEEGECWEKALMREFHETTSSKWLWTMSSNRKLASAKSSNTAQGKLSPLLRPTLELHRETESNSAAKEFIEPALFFPPSLTRPFPHTAVWHLSHSHRVMIH